MSIKGVQNSIGFNYQIKSDKKTIAAENKPQKTGVSRPSTTNTLPLNFAGLSSLPFKGTINSSDSKKSYTPLDVKKTLIQFAKNHRLNQYDINMTFKSIFDNVEKLDYENIEGHLENIDVLFGCVANSVKSIVDNGYFYSKDGLDAFNILREKYSVKPKNSGCVSPITIPLSDYKPKDILTIQKRGLIDNLDKSQFIKKIAEMSDEEYFEYKNKIAKSIAETGKTYAELSDELKEKLKPLASENVSNVFFEKYAHEGSVIASIKMLDFLKDYPVEFKGFKLIDLLECVDVDNLEQFENVLNKLKERENLSSYDVASILAVTNPKTEDTILSLIGDKDIPLKTIVKYLESEKDFKSGKVSKEEITSKINNDPLVKTIHEIKGNGVLLKPQNTEPTPLNPMDIKPSALALVHLTNYEPENGVILSTRDKIGGSRNSVHFTLNHPVASHHFGDWEESKYAIIMPFETTVEKNGKGKIIEGMPNDVYTNGSVKIPEGSIIIKHNDEIEKGSIKISDYPGASGVKMIETSEFPHKITSTVIEQMGYTHLEADGPTGLFSYGENKGKSVSSATENYKGWKDFCDSNGLKVSHHSGSPGGLAESFIEDIDMLAVVDRWKIEGKDYRKQLLHDIKIVKKWQQKGYFVSYDLDKLSRIIDKSATPKQALEKIKEELGFHPTLHREQFNGCMLDKSMDLHEQFLEAVDNPQKMAKFIKKELDYSF